MTLSLFLNIITTTLIVVGGVLALLQLHQLYKQRSREIALQMLLQTPEFLAAINIVFEPPDGLNKK